MSARQLLTAIGLLLLTLALLTTTTHGQAEEQNNHLDCTENVTVQAGDTLSLIAGRTLGSQLAYTQILEATNAKAANDASYTFVQNANLVNIGWKLCIPGRGSVIGSSAPAAVATPSIVRQTTVRQTTVRQTTVPTTTTALTSIAEISTTRVFTDSPHPLMIAEMRQQSYSGSDIVIEQTLESGTNYSRYIASYLSEGNKIFALLTVPFGTRPATGWPVVIFNHGYIPPEIYRTTERYIAYVDAFARNGYVVLRSDYRGHGSSEGEATGGYGSPDYTVDILNAVAAVKRYADADPNRIGMWGHSMGGQITLRSMVVIDDIKAGVIWAGVVGSYPDLLDNWHRRNGNIPPANIPQRWRRWREELVRDYGAPDENPEFWASISPNAYLADLSGPIQLHHGTVDKSVPVEFSITLNRQIQAVGIPVESYTYEGDNHNISVNFGTAMARSVAFFDRYVKNRQPLR